LRPISALARQIGFESARSTLGPRVRSHQNHNWRAAAGRCSRLARPTKAPKCRQTPNGANSRRPKPTRSPAHEPVERPRGQRAQKPIDRPPNPASGDACETGQAHPMPGALSAATKPEARGLLSFPSGIHDRSCPQRWPHPSLGPNPEPPVRPSGSTTAAPELVEGRTVKRTIRGLQSGSSSSPLCLPTKIFVQPTAWHRTNALRRLLDRGPQQP
jgi:hypothetical protein